MAEVGSIPCTSCFSQPCMCGLSKEAFKKRIKGTPWRKRRPSPEMRKTFGMLAEAEAHSKRKWGE